MTIAAFCERAKLPIVIDRGYHDATWAPRSDEHGVVCLAVDENFAIDREMHPGMARVLLRWHRYGHVFTAEAANLLREIVAEAELRLPS